MSDNYWDRIAEEVMRRKTGSPVLARNFVAFYTDTRIEELLCDAVARYNKDKNILLLDVGCGPGKWTRRFMKNFPKMTVVGLDLSRQMLRLAKMKQLQEEAYLVRNNAASMAFPDNSFDIVTSVTVLQHMLLEDIWRKAIREMVRVTRKGGHIILCDAFFSFTFKVRKMVDYISSFKSAGADLVSWEGVDPSYFVKLLGLIGYTRSFDEEKVYYFKRFRKLSSASSRMLALIAHSTDSHLGRSSLAMFAPHKVMVFEKRAALSRNYVLK